MKVRMEIQEDLTEDEVVIRCTHINESLLKLKTLIRDFGNDTKSLILTRGDTEFFVPQERILFFETEGKIVTAHTADKMYETQYRLYELEEMLLGYFMRISKSTIVNLNQIYSITRNLTASSVVEFSDSIKRIYVSRNYYRSNLRWLHFLACEDLSEHIPEVINKYTIHLTDGRICSFLAFRPLKIRKICVG